MTARDSSGGGSSLRLATLAVTLAIQAGLIVMLRANPDALPSIANLGVLGLSLVTGGLLGFEAYRQSDRTASWWRPDWTRWAFGGAIFGANVGVALAYLLRKREVARTDEPTGLWELPVVLSVVGSTAGTAVLNVYFDVSSAETSLTVLSSGLLLGVFALVGFTFVATYYDTRYVNRALGAGGNDWLLGGYHWVVLVGLPIPGRIVILLVYIYRRRRLLGGVAGENGDIDSLPTGRPGPEDGDEDGEDLDGEDLDGGTAHDRTTERPGEE